MMKKLLTLIFLGVALGANAQNVGINTNSPKATLEVVGAPATPGTADGIIPPKLTRAQLIAKTSYGTDQIGAVVYVTDLSGATNTATANVLTTGLYYFDGSVWLTVANSIPFGDIKTGIQAADHNGWVKLDGRAKTTLTATQQAKATALSIGANLPNATGAVLMQNGGTLGAVGGTNNRTITQGHLPNVNFGGVINEVVHGEIGGSASGVFTRSVSTEGGGNLKSSSAGGGATNRYTLNINLNGGVTPTALDITPRSLSVNTFIYLGL